MGLSTRAEWRSNVLKFSMNLLDDLRPRPITRDLDWWQGGFADV